jgi:Ser-tRNA(Ala) deacylase AlaX
MTALLYLDDSYLDAFDATVLATNAELGGVALDRSAF